MREKKKTKGFRGYMFDLSCMDEKEEWNKIQI